MKGTEIFVAVKLFHIPLLERNKVKVDELEAEIKQFNNVVSKSIGKLIEIKREDNTLWVVSEHINGRDLASCIENHGSVSEKVARTWFKKIIQGVAAMHEHKCVHKDLKLDNILLKFKKEGTQDVIDDVKIVD